MNIMDTPTNGAKPDALLEDVLQSALSGIMALESVRDSETEEIVDFRWILANNQAEQLLGRPPGYLNGRNLLEEMPGYNDDRLFGRFVQVVETGEPAHFTVDYRTDGVGGVFSVQAVNHGDGFVATFNDITELVDAWVHSDTLASRLELATGSANLGIWDLDMVNDRIVWDDRMMALHGWTRDAFEKTTQPWADRLHPEDREWATEALAKATQDDADVSLQYRVVWPDDSVHHLEAHGTIIRDDAGEPERMAGVAWDVTEQVALEAERAKAISRMEDANKAKTEFLAMMSHDLRTPLNAIIGFATMMEHEEFGPLGHPKYKDYIKSVNESGATLLRIIAGILDIAEVESGSLTLNREPVDIARLIYGVSAMLDILTRERSLKINVDIQSQIPKLMLDEHYVDQAFMNILTNAIKFSDDGSEIRITLEYDQEAGVQLQIQDTGPGMAETQISLALEPFSHKNSRQARASDGAGLGLPLARIIIEEHGGELIVESDLGEGTKVTVQFPPALIAAAN